MSYSARLLAQIIDTLIVTLAAASSGAAAVAVIFQTYYPTSPRMSDAMSLVEYVTRLSVHWLYYALLESSHRQATLGKRLLRLKVVDEDGQRITFSRATARYWMSWISFLPLFAGYTIAPFTRRRQTLHDIIARTLVINPPRTPPQP